MLSKITDAWNSFEAWVHSWFPGFKTKAMLGLGTVSSAAGLTYDYIQGLPETKWLSKEALLATSFVLFTLSYWFKDMGKRVDEAKEDN